MKKVTILLVTGLLVLSVAGTVMAVPLTRDNVKGVVEAVETAAGIVSIREHDTGVLYDIVVAPDDLASAEVSLSASVNYFIDSNGTLIAEGASFFPGDSSAAGSAAAVLADEVLSANIAEADGTTGQNTNIGSGVKRGHIQNGAISTPKLKNNAVKTWKIADGAVTNPKLANNSVNSAKIADGTVGTSDLANGAVTSEKLLDGTVTTSKLVDGAVTNSKITNDAVTSAKIADGSIIASDLANDSVTSTILLDGAVTNTKLASNSVNSAKIANGTVSASDLADGAVTSAKLLDGAVLSEILDDDGSGSGLDADLLDGLSSSSFSLSGHWHNSLNASDGSPINALYVNPSGYVGIGTASPSSVLDVNGDIRVRGGDLLDTGGTSRVRVTDDGDTYLNDAGGTARMRIIDNGDTVFLNSSGSTRLTVDTTGNIGIGTTAPGSPLDVIGDIKASGDYTYRSDKTYYYSVSGNRFVPMGTASLRISLWGFRYHTTTATSSEALQPVHLPQGATVTEFTCYTYDNDASNNITMGWTLARRPYSEPNTSYGLAGASYSTSGSSTTLRSGTDTTVNSAVIDNSTNTYQVYSIMTRSAGTTNTSSLRDYGCRISYTMTTVAP